MAKTSVHINLIIDTYKIFEISLQQSDLIPSDFIREYKFNPARKWKIDFSWPNHQPRLAVEIEGGSWMKKGGHTTGTGFNKDIEKYNCLALVGFYLLRFTPQQVESCEAIEVIERWFHLRGR